MTPEEFAGKIEWEGGLLEATVGYGLKATDLEPGIDPELYKAMTEYDAWLDKGKPLIQKIDALLYKHL